MCKLLISIIILPGECTWNAYRVHYSSWCPTTVQTKLSYCMGRIESRFGLNNLITHIFHAKPLFRNKAFGVTFSYLMKVEVQKSQISLFLNFQVKIFVFIYMYIIGWDRRDFQFSKILHNSDVVIQTYIDKKHAATSLNFIDRPEKMLPPRLKQYSDLSKNLWCIICKFVMCSFQRAGLSWCSVFLKNLLKPVIGKQVNIHVRGLSRLINNPQYKHLWKVWTTWLLERFWGEN